ncbi:iron transporter [Halovenus rubra]|uniref:Iron transporter n=2 Tax=Halovenus rubra TaxID=869890 RepID=A0ABD5X3U4_9EURY|nr:iron transporter [Halovenus rubra]
MTSNEDTTVHERNRLPRRQILAGGSATLLTALAGCLGSDGDGDNKSGPDESTPTPPPVADTDSSPQIPEVSDPPEAVYRPAHMADMNHLGAVEAGPYMVSPMLSYPHSFWLVTGSKAERVRPQGPGVHLMFSVWDRQTGTVLPVDVGAQTQVRRDGEIVDTRSPWPMISQTMGFHFGDNISLAGPGTYTVEVQLNPITVRRTGEFANTFETTQTATFEFEFDEELQEQLVNNITYFDKKQWGKQEALEPMGGMSMGGDESTQGTYEGGSDMNDGGDGSKMDDDSGMEMGGGMMPYSSLPAANSYPGQAVGEPTSGDASFVVRYLTDTAPVEDGYLFVSARTPYNRVPLADMALSVTGAVEGELVQTLDSNLGHHYGLAGSLAPGDTVELTVDSPPQVARHVGYETAFLEMESMTVEVSE